jgi:Prp8 binding protein
MALSPDGKSLVTNAMDNTVRAWDVQPFVAGDRMLKVFLGKAEA